MNKFTLDINGKKRETQADSDTPLLWVLRDNFDLVGTKYGCGIGQCGACTVHIDGKAMKSCLTTIGSVGNKKIVTIEGLSKDGNHPVQKAWKEIDVPQCGYCQSGQIMTATAFLNDNPNPTNMEIRKAMDGNICRCASYNRIEKAIKKAATG